MGLSGRRSAPSAPPIPSPAPPPSAYGITTSGTIPAQAAPYQAAPYQPVGQHLPAPPPPPRAVPAAAPPFGAPPVQPSQFGAPPVAPSRFGTPAPSPFGTPQAQPGGYGAPYAKPPFGDPGPTRSGGRSGTAMWVRIAVSLFLFLVVGGGGLKVWDKLHAHHVGELPATLVGLPAVTGDAAAAMSERLANANFSQYHISPAHLGAYQDGSTVVIALVGGIPSGWNRDKQGFLDGLNTGSGGVFSTVPAGRQGGTESCSQMNATAAACVWIDDGTVGLVIVPGEVPTAQVDLQSLRDATER